jgi:hypothetical protein
LATCERRMAKYAVSITTTLETDDRRHAETRRPVRAVANA